MDSRARRRLAVEAVAIVVIVASLTVGAVLIAQTGWGLADLICGDEDVGSVASPDGHVRARVFVRNCGATTRFATHVAIVRSRPIVPDTSDTVFIGDARDGTFNSAGGPEVRPSWEGSRDLVISYDDATMAYVAAEKSGDVKVRYVAFSSRSLESQRR